MKKFTKVVLGMMLAVIFGTILGSNPVDASDHSVGGIYHYKVVRIRSMINTERVIGINETNVNQVILNNTSAFIWGGEWEARYLPDNDTYLFWQFSFYNGQYGPIYLSVSDSQDANGNNIIGTKLTHLEGFQQEWRIIPVSSHREGIVYLFESVTHEGKALDIPDSNADQEDVIAFRRHGGVNQQFLVQVLRDAP
jgi:hypothetical protein